MRLKKLEIFGFKSFADKIEIQFDQGITAIVGPNGSGKSNISDAVRWVLGEQNARVLRGGRMEDIIFSGTSRRKPLSYCEVNLTIDNVDGTLPIAYGEVTITRRVFRSGESEYYINRQSCRLKDVIELFRDTGIGKEGYSIVGQGQITEIVNYRPEERRGAVHESAGIMKFRVRKEEAERRLENTKTNLMRLNDITSEIGLQLEPLQKQSEDARLYLTLSEELKDLEINQYLLQYDNVKARLQALEEQKAQAADRLTQQNAQVEALEASLRTQQSRQDALEEQGNALRDELAALAAEEQRRAGERNLTLERLSALRRDAERLTGEERSREERRIELLQATEALAEELVGQQSAIDEGQRAITAREQELASMGDQLRLDEERAESQKSGLMASLNKIGDIRSTLARLDAMQQSIRTRMGQMDDAEQKLNRELSLIEEAAAEIDSTLAALETKLAQARSARTQAEELVRELSVRQRAAEETGAKSRERLQAAVTRINMLTAMKRDYEGYAEAVKRLLVDCRRDDNLNRMVEGVIGELIEVPSELVRALEMALGPAMQNIVTPDEEAAKGLINHLRRMNYGRATFLPVASIRGRSLNAHETKVLNMSGCLGVASELVKYDPRYRNIVGSLLGRVVVARDMDSAITMARACGHTLRFTTLQGDIINTGGSMTGGSIHSRFTSLLGRSAELEELISLRGRIEEELRTQSAAIRQTQEQGVTAAATLEQAAQAAHGAELEHAREQERRNRASQSEERVRSQLAQLSEERQLLLDNLRDIDAERMTAESRQGGEEQSNASAREQIIRIQQQINEQRERFNDLQDAVNADKIAMATAVRNYASLQADQSRLERDIEELARKAQLTHEALAQSQQRIEQEEQSLQQSAEETTDDRRQAAQQRLQGLEAQRTALRTKRAEEEQLLAQCRSMLEELREQQYKLQNQGNRAEADLENLQNRIWDNYALTYAMALELRRADFESAGANRRIGEIRERIRAMGTVNVNAIEDYVALKDRWEEYQRQIADLVKAEGDLMSIIAELTEKMEKRFRQQFALLNTYFSETFAEMFGGGQARLVLNDESDLLNSGIEIEAQPPGKQLQLLSLLSGGEKALTAISLLFAMLKLNPSPFCVLDEIEAALDDINVKRFADYLNTYTSKTQFVVVTHRKGTMEASNAIYGVTMEEKGISTLVSMKMADYVG